MWIFRHPALLPRCRRPHYHRSAAMPSLDVNGVHLYYEEHGKGFAVVFAHGAGGNHLSFTLAYPQRVRGLVMANTFAGMRREVWLASDDSLRREVQSIWERRRADGIKRALGPHFARTHP